LNISSDSSQAEKEVSMSWYLDVLKKYAVFEGRARRKEYWYFILFNVLIEVALLFVFYLMAWYNVEGGLGVFIIIYSLDVFIPGLAVAFRRLNDTGRNGRCFSSA
jgi:uncharacterized membrane protein YhaH (DUF805 family)